MQLGTENRNKTMAAIGSDGRGARVCCGASDSRFSGRGEIPYPGCDATTRDAPDRDGEKRARKKARP